MSTSPSRKRVENYEVYDFGTKRAQIILTHHLVEHNLHIRIFKSRSTKTWSNFNWRGGRRSGTGAKNCYNLL